MVTIDPPPAVRIIAGIACLQARNMVSTFTCITRAQFSSARLVRNSLNAMYQRQVNVIGLILNSVNTEMPDYYYYRYPKYYAA